MSFIVRKLPLAEQDALDAAIWYEERQPGLGAEFLNEVDRAVRALSDSALLHRIDLQTFAGRQYTGSDSTASITSSEKTRFGYWRSFTGEGTRERGKNGADKPRKFAMTTAPQTEARPLLQNCG